MPGPVVLEGESITLRVIERADIPFLQEMLHNPALWQGFGAPTPRNHHQMEKHFETQNEGHAFLICRDSEPIGRVRLVDMDDTWRNAEVTCYVKPPAQQDGVATEACRLLIDYAFNTLGLHRLVVRIFETNAASQALAGTLGFTKEGTLREHVYHAGEYRDLYVYGLLRTEWGQS